jgi:hypothetical protein
VGRKIETLHVVSVHRKFMIPSNLLCPAAQAERRDDSEMRFVVAVPPCAARPTSLASPGPCAGPFLSSSSHPSMTASRPQLSHLLIAILCTTFLHIGSFFRQQHPLGNTHPNSEFVSPQKTRNRKPHHLHSPKEQVRYGTSGNSTVEHATRSCISPEAGSHARVHKRLSTH